VSCSTRTRAATVPAPPSSSGCGPSSAARTSGRRARRFGGWCGTVLGGRRAPREAADGDLATAAGLEPGEAAKHLNALSRAGLAARVGANLHFDPVALEALVARIVAICEGEGEVTIAGVRDELGTTRRYAQALLEHMDAQRVTRRQGDTHVLRRARPS